jgi:hypothetical protein
MPRRRQPQILQNVRRTFVLQTQRAAHTYPPQTARCLASTIFCLRTERYRLRPYLSSQAIGPFLFKLSKLDREGVILRSNPTYIPLEGDAARANVEVAVSMPKVVRRAKGRDSAGDRPLHQLL